MRMDELLNICVDENRPFLLLQKYPVSTCYLEIFSSIGEFKTLPMFYKSVINVLEIPDDDTLGLQHVHVAVIASVLNTPDQSVKSRNRSKDVDLVDVGDTLVSGGADGWLAGDLRVCELMRYFL
ncbi:hypothetical protein K0M31_003598 [Melipona bicolor]|uniref:Uncharacterized protein n=1 Tax=Melipona bicolor TaxID=60889 RepID=A0AA40FZC3_9HYME|nr:hypothetical protein K0M31_003598 [Melipona bicolor]